VTVTFSPEEPAGSAKVLTFDKVVRFERGRVVLITHDGDRLRAR
jgi:hypothetical protein